MLRSVWSPALAAVFLAAPVSPALAQTWSFDGEAARTAGDPALMLGCGVGPGASETFVLRVRSDPFGVVAGETRELEAAVDRAPLGRAPFLNQGPGQGLVVLLPRAHPLTEAMRRGSALSLRDAAGGASFEVSLSGSSSALAALEAHCGGATETAERPPSQPAPAQQADAETANAPGASTADAGRRDAPAAVPVDMPSTPQDVSRRLALEAVRRAPALLDDENFAIAWRNAALPRSERANLVTNRSTPAERAAAAAQGRAMLQREAAALPDGPFFLGWTSGHAFAAATVTDQGLVPASGLPRDGGDGRFSTHLGFVDSGLMLPGGPSMRVRARSRFDASVLRADRALAERVKEAGGANELRIAIEISDVVITGVGGGAPQMVASGEVRFVGLYPRRMNRRADEPSPEPFLDPGALIHAFAPVAEPAGGPGFAAMARRIDLQTTAAGDAFLDGQTATGRSDVATLVQLLAARAAGQTGPLPDAVRREAFESLATPFERDDAIHPSRLAPGAPGRARLAFAPHVDEFEKADLLARIDSVIWPRIMADLPALPVEGVSYVGTWLGEYDASRGGFPMNVDHRALGLPATGEYPAMTGLPDFLPATQEDAQRLLAALGARDGAGSRQVQFMLRYRLAAVEAAAYGEQRAPEATVEPLDLTLHARARLMEGEDPASAAVARFDLAAWRGAARPVASDARVAFWEEVATPPRADADGIIAAALAVAEEPEALAARLAAEASAVAGAGPAERDARLSETVAALRAATAPDEIVLDGLLNLDGYDPEAGAFAVGRITYRPAQGSLGVNPPAIAYVDQSGFAPLPVAPELVEAFERRAQGKPAGTAEVTVWIKPVLTTQERGRDVLYVAVTRLVARSNATDGTGYPEAHVDIRPAAYAPEPAPAAAAAADAPEAVPFDAEYLDLMMVRRFGAELPEATWARMMLDRRVYELVVASLGQPPTWGPFFDDPTRAMNPVEERDALTRFRAWTEARAAALPERVYLRDRSGMIPPQITCGMMHAPPDRGYADHVPPEIAAMLDAADHTAAFHKRVAFERALSRSAYRLPYLHVAFYGRPSVRGNGLRSDSGASSCGRVLGNVRIEDFGDAAHVDALVRVEGLFRAPVEQGQAVELRHHGRVAAATFVPAQGAEAAGGRLGAFDVVFAVERTEILPVTQPDRSGGIVYGPATVLDAARLAAMRPPPPQATDVLGISPRQPWEEARALAAARIPDPILGVNDGPPDNFREQSSNTLLGPEPIFNAFRNGHFLFARDGGEAVALVREAERDPERVLAVGSYRRFAAGSVTQDALVGALLRKYGDKPETEDDPSYYGERPGLALAWGAAPSCLPSMRENVRADDVAREDNAAHQTARAIGQRFAAPQLQFGGHGAMLLERCEPVVWASVGVDREGVAHMTVWSLDLALLAEVGLMPSLTLSVDDEQGAETLKDQAADIDL